MIDYGRVDNAINFYTGKGYERFEANEIEDVLSFHDSGSYVLTNLDPKKMAVGTHLIKMDDVSTVGLLTTIEDAMEFFKMELWIDELEPEALRLEDLEDNNFEIFYKKTKIGSYGIQQNERSKRWIYGTGLLEPKFTTAIQ